MLPILQVGLGPLGRRVASDLHQRGLGRVVAAVDPAPELVGRPLAELVPEADPDLVIRGSLEEVDDGPAIRCALVTTSSDLELCMETFRGLMRRGAAAISTCEELSWPWLRHPVLAQELAELAVRHGGRLLGTGVNPGFLMDALPVVASTVCRSVERVTVERIQDASTRRLPFQRKIGAGLDADEFERRVQAGTLRHVGLGESLHFLAHALGMQVESWDETIEPVLAEAPLDCGLGPIAAGQARGVRQVARARVGGTEALELVFQASIAQADPRDRIRIEGEPPVEVILPGGVHGDVATSAIVLNMIRPLLLAEPGLHTMGTLPLQGFAAPDDFAAR